MSSLLSQIGSHQPPTLRCVFPVSRYQGGPPSVLPPPLSPPCLTRGPPRSSTFLLYFSPKSLIYNAGTEKTRSVCNSYFSLTTNERTEIKQMSSSIDNFRQMVARTVLDNFRVVGDNSDDIRAVFQVVLRLSQDVGECEDLVDLDNSGQFNYLQNQSVSLISVNQRRFFRKQPNHRVSKNCRQVVKTVASYHHQPPPAKMFSIRFYKMSK